MRFQMVYWSKPGKTASHTKIHLVAESLNDDFGRTGCGKRYPRGWSSVSEEDIAALECKNCHRALNSEPKMTQRSDGTWVRNT